MLTGNPDITGPLLVESLQRTAKLQSDLHALEQRIDGIEGNNGGQGSDQQQGEIEPSRLLTLRANSEMLNEAQKQVKKLIKVRMLSDIIRAFSDRELYRR